MIKLCLLPHIFKEPEVTLVPDPRSVKVASGNSMIDYLQTILWMHMGSKTQLRQFSVDSDKCLQI